MQPLLLRPCLLRFTTNQLAAIHLHAIYLLVVKCKSYYKKKEETFLANCFFFLWNFSSQRETDRTRGEEKELQKGTRKVKNNKKKAKHFLAACLR